VGLCKRPKIFKAIDPLIISFGKLSKIKDKTSLCFSKASLDGVKVI
jgi:hypothetical protein